MKRTRWLQETRMMRFEEAYFGWSRDRLAQREAARLLGICERTSRRYNHRYEEDGMEGLWDKRLTQVSHPRAPVDKVMQVLGTYREHYRGVKHQVFV